MLEIMVQEKVPDAGEQRAWRDFDQLFKQTCIREAAGNVVLDGVAFAAFAQEAHMPLIEKGIAVYNGCVKALAGLEGHECRVFKCLSQLYLSAKMALKYK
jgi:hypothetical protein